MVFGCYTKGRKQRRRPGLLASRQRARRPRVLSLGCSRPRRLACHIKWPRACRARRHPSFFERSSSHCSMLTLLKTSAGASILTCAIKTGVVSAERSWQSERLENASRQHSPNSVGSRRIFHSRCWRFHSRRCFAKGACQSLLCETPSALMGLVHRWVEGRRPWRPSLQSIAFRL